MGDALDRVKAEVLGVTGEYLPCLGLESGQTKCNAALARETVFVQIMEMFESLYCMRRCFV